MPWYEMAGLLTSKGFIKASSFVISSIIQPKNVPTPSFSNRHTHLIQTVTPTRTFAESRASPDNRGCTVEHFLRLLSYKFDWASYENHMRNPKVVTESDITQSGVFNL